MTLARSRARSNIFGDLMKSVFWIETSVTLPSGKSVAYVYEAEAGSVEELADRLADRGVIYGNRLHTTDDGRGGRLVTARIPTALTVRGIARISPYEYRVWEPEDAPAGTVA